jgi:hypothetical protein
MKLNKVVTIPALALTAGLGLGDKVNIKKIIAIPAIALAAGLGLAACGNSGGSSPGQPNIFNTPNGGTGNATACTDYGNAVGAAQNGDTSTMYADMQQAVSDSTDSQMSTDLASWSTDNNDGGSTVSDITNLNWDCSAYNGYTGGRAS